MTPAHSDALMRASGEALLEGVDLQAVRSIDTDEAKRLAVLIRDDPDDISPSDLQALALWAAKGGMLQT